MEELYDAGFDTLGQADSKWTKKSSKITVDSTGVVTFDYAYSNFAGSGNYAVSGEIIVNETTVTPLLHEQ